jgi:hypothetical protein
VAYRRDHRRGRLRGQLVFHTTAWLVALVTDLTEACADLAHLIPALIPALTRDNTPGNTRTILSAGGVVNTDVLHAMLTLRDEIPRIRAEACDILSEPYPPRPVLTCLRALPRLASRLHDLGHISREKQIEHAVSRWIALTKLALGLRTRNQPIGWNCPLHAEPCELVSLGSEGFLRDDQSVHWEHAATILCQLCGATWPEMQWNHLGRILETA